MSKPSIILTLFLLCSAPLFAQQGKPIETGNFLVTNYSRSFLYKCGWSNQ
jgi:hypothetical protein